MRTTTGKLDIFWRVWVLPGDDVWKLASGPEIKHNRQARKVTLDREQYARLLEGRLSLSEPLEHDARVLEPAA